MGKNFSGNSNPDRNKNDFYPTPRYIVKLLGSKIPFDYKNKVILEPADGNGNISDHLKYLGHKVITHDIQTDGVDFLTYEKETNIDLIVTNPPFKLFDNFVEKSLSICDEVWLIGKTDYFSTHSRTVKGIWNHLKCVYIFDRKVDYKLEEYPFGCFTTGMLHTGWFHFDKNYVGPKMLEIVDVSDGVFKGYDYYAKFLTVRTNPN